MSKNFEKLFIAFVGTLDVYRELNIARWEKYDFEEYKTKSYAFNRNLELLEVYLHEYLQEVYRGHDEESSCQNANGIVD